MRKVKYPAEWDLSGQFKDTPQNIKKERARTKTAYLSFAKKWRNRVDYLKKPSILRKALDELENLSKNYAPREPRYLNLRSSKESDNNEIKARINNVTAFYTPIFNELEYFDINISKIPKKHQPKFLKSKELQKYKHFLEKIFRRGEHNLTEAEEKILNLKSPLCHRNWTRMLSSLISKEEVEIIDDKLKKGKIPFSQITPLLQSRVKKVRDTAAREFYRVLDKHSDVAEHEMNSILQNKRINDELRGYKRPDEASHLGDDIESAVVDKLLERVTEHFKVAQKYYSFRTKLTGIKKPRYYERFVSVTKNESTKYSYDKSVSLVYKVLASLDSEFGDMFMKMVKNGQIDVYPQKGKQGGAFCNYGGLKEPTYVFLNHNNELRNVTTLAHEMGHAINGELVKKNESPFNMSDSLATAEIASTFMEDFVLERLSHEISDEERLPLLIENLDDITSSIFRQVAAYNFEKELHEQARLKGYISKQEIGQIFAKHMKSYLGPVFNLEKELELGWIHWDHFRYFFYVYSYASGLLISKYLQREVRKNPEFIKKVKEFLSTGGSKSPKDILKELGVDITKATFWDTGLKEIERELDETIKVAKKLGKI